MLRAYKYRLYPTKTQSVLLNKHIGSCRLVYNLALEVKDTAYKNKGLSLSGYDLMNQLPELKKEFDWLKELDSQCLQQAIINLDKAFSSFFKGHAKFPQRKTRKRGAQSFRSPHGNNIRIEGDKVSLPKFKEGIKFAQDRKFKGEIKSATVSRTPTGKYFISILVDTGVKEPDKRPIIANTTVGIDLGIKSFLVTSDGRSYDNPKYLRSNMQRLKVLSRRASRKKNKSVNKRRAYIRLAALHEKVRNQRKDFLHKLSTDLVKNNDTICMEDLAVKNMVRNHKLALSISDAGWGMFGEMIAYKCLWYGKNKLIIPRFEPSTKVCNVCGSKVHALTLADREWTCATCLTEHDRDINAAKVIKEYCLQHSGMGSPGEPMESPTMVGALK